MNGKILEKPKSVEGAIAMLTELSGKTHNVFSGVALICNHSITLLSSTFEKQCRTLDTYFCGKNPSAYGRVVI